MTDVAAAVPETPSSVPCPISAKTASPDDAVRRRTAERLAEHLEKGAALLARCEELANVRRGDRLGPLYAAARLMQANAHVAEALAHVAQVERRRRSIVERVQPPDPKKAKLNSYWQERKSGAEERLRVYRLLNEHVQQSIRARTGETDERDRVAWMIEEEKKELARLKEREAENGAGETS